MQKHYSESLDVINGMLLALIVMYALLHTNKTCKAWLEHYFYLNNSNPQHDGCDESKFIPQSLINLCGKRSLTEEVLHCVTKGLLSPITNPDQVTAV